MCGEQHYIINGWKSKKNIKKNDDKKELIKIRKAFNYIQNSGIRYFDGYGLVNIFRLYDNSLYSIILNPLSINDFEKSIKIAYNDFLNNELNYPDWLLKIMVYEHLVSTQQTRNTFVEPYYQVILMLLGNIIKESSNNINLRLEVGRRGATRPIIRFY